MKLKPEYLVYTSGILFLIAFILFAYYNFPILYKYNHIPIDKRYLYIPLIQDVKFKYECGLWLSPVIVAIMCLLNYFDYFKLINELELKKNIKKHIKEGVLLFRLYRKNRNI